MHHESRERTTGASEDQVIDAIAEEIEEAQAARPDVVAAGLGIPCTIDRERGVAINAVNLTSPTSRSATSMHERPGCRSSSTTTPTSPPSRSTASAPAKGADNAVMLTIGTGIGGGLIIDGELYRGSIGAGAEPGHMVIDLNGPPCQGTCPNHGCIEALASGHRAGARGHAPRPSASPTRRSGARAGARGTIERQTVTDAAMDGDEARDRGGGSRSGRRLGVGLSSLANIFNPDVIVIGGGVSAAGDLLLGPPREELRNRALPPMNETPVKVAELGDDAGMIGAAAMALTNSTTSEA